MENARGEEVSGVNEKKKRRRRRVSWGTVLMLLFTALVIAACLVFMLRIAGNDVYARTGEFIRSLSEQGIFVEAPAPQATDAPQRTITFIEDETPLPVAKITPTPVPQKRTIRIAAAGAIYAPKAVRQSAQIGKRFDFTQTFAGVKDALQSADLAIATLETTTAGERAGYGNYNTPVQMLDALRASGVDLLALATERALDKGYEGLELTVSELTARGLFYAGLNAEKTASQATMMRIGGVQVAVLAYTYDLSDEGKKLTKGDERKMLSLIDANAMIEDVRQARVAGANLVIVLPHWGTKNKQDTPDTLHMLARQLAEAGADVILGTHPNVVQGTERLTVTRADGLDYEAVVCYSLGSLMTDARPAENTAGMIAQLDVTYDPITRRTTLGELDCVPVYIARQREDGKTVYRAVNAQDEQAIALLTDDERAQAQLAVQRVHEATQDGREGGHIR